MFEMRAQLWWTPADVPARPVETAVLDLLRAVDTSGSLLKAARQIGLSYRHAWALMGKWAKLLGQPLLVLERGRGASLTPLASRLLAAQRRANAHLAPEIGSLISDITSDVRVSARPQQPRLRIHASHDLALANLRDALNAGDGLQLDVQFQGSLDSLAALARGTCEVAGFHLTTGENTGEAAASFRHWLKPRSHKLIHFATREQGLMLAAGNPLAVEGLADLASKHVRMINRQRGSGTRMEFDQLLKAAGIAGELLIGYHTEEFTHLAVAATVAGGLADAGFGIKAAASQFGLHFIPLVGEQYFLACRNAALGRPPVRQLLAMLEAEPFKSMAARLPGYDAALSGNVIEVQQILPARNTPASRRAVSA